MKKTLPNVTLLFLTAEMKSQIEIMFLTSTIIQKIYKKHTLCPISEISEKDLFVCLENGIYKKKVNEMSARQKISVEENTFYGEKKKHKEKVWLLHSETSSI